MSISEVEAKSILRKHKRIDSWFVSCYGMNLYRGCTHNCVYCDGRAEKYNVDGEFGKDVVVKVNAIDLLRRELDPSRKRKPMKRCFFMIGGGVGDSYQPAEKRFGLTRRTLELMVEFGHPVSVLTKSALVLRDLDVLTEINEQSRALVSFSFSGVDEKISARFEPGVPPPSERLRAMEQLSKAGITCGMFLLPVLPFLTDSQRQIEDSLKRGLDHGVSFVIFGGLTLKDGRQKEFFVRTLTESFPDLTAEYDSVYQASPWGAPNGEYHRSLNEIFAEAVSKFHLPPRIPRQLFQDILEENDYVAVVLDQLDYLLKLKHRTTPFGYASYGVSQLTEPVSVVRSEGRLQRIKGVGPATERVIKEILDTGTCKMYEENIYL
jgi:DNA repair photolyase